jgi:hypothetical protein
MPSFPLPLADPSCDGPSSCPGVACFSIQHTFAVQSVAFSSSSRLVRPQKPLTYRLRLGPLVRTLQGACPGASPPFSRDQVSPPAPPYPRLTLIAPSSCPHQPSLLLVISFVVPLVSVLLISALVMRNAWDVHNAVLSVLMSYTMAGLVTQVVKVRPCSILTSSALLSDSRQRARARGAAEARLAGRRVQRARVLLADDHPTVPVSFSRTRSPSVAPVRT